VTESPPVIGLRREREVLTVALRTNRHVVLEGPPGTGKSTLLRSIAAEVGQEVVFVEGNAELTPARLIGQYDPAAVLAEGYVPGSFTDGPLLTAMRGSGLLYLEELNRIPEETLNVLITVMSEAELHVPRLGRVAATPGFLLVAAMNPFDAVGTARISSAVYDRTCRLTMDYQDMADEVAIVAREAGEAAADLRWLSGVVQLVRRTRSHPDLRIGSSVRGAIDTVVVAARLSGLRGQPAHDAKVGLDAALVALSGRVRVRDGAGRTSEDVITELWASIFGSPDGEAGKGDAPEGATVKTSSTS